MSSSQHPDDSAQEAQNGPIGWASPTYVSDDYDSDASDYDSDENSSNSSGMDTPEDSDDDEYDEEDEDEEINEYTDFNGDNSTQVVDGDVQQFYESNDFTSAPQDHDSDYNDLEQHETTHEASSTQQYPHTNGNQAHFIENAYQAFLSNPLARIQASGAQQNQPEQRKVTVMGVSHDYRAVPSLVQSPFYTQDQKYAILLQCPRSVLDRLYEEWVVAYGHLLSVPLPWPVNGQPVAVIQQALQSIPANIQQVQPTQELQELQEQQPQIQQPQAQQPAVQQPQAQQPQVQQPQVQQHLPANPPSAQPMQQYSSLAIQQPLPSMPQALPAHLQQPVFQMAPQLNFDFDDLNQDTYMPLDPDNDEPPRDPTAPAPIYPAYYGHFRNGAEARAYRRRTKFAPGNKTTAQDVERVRRHGREYWVRRLYNAMIDVSHVADGKNSVHRLRITANVAFNPVDLEAAAHKAFDRALDAHERGFTKPMVYHKRVVRGKLSDRSEGSVESRLASLCACFATQKATVDDAVRGGVTLALLCDNPHARGSTKYSNNIGNGKRGGRLKYAKVAEEKERLRAEKKAAREAAKAAKDAEKAAKKAAKEMAKQQREQLKQWKQQQQTGKGRTN